MNYPASFNDKRKALILQLTSEGSATTTLRLPYTPNSDGQRRQDRCACKLVIRALRQALAPEQEIKLALQSLVGAMAAPEQARTMARDLANRDFTIHVNQTPGRPSEDAPMPA